MAPPPTVLFPTSPASAMGPRSVEFKDKDKDKGVNVQVLLRCRPFNDEELRTNAPQVISCNDHRREVTVSQNIASKQIDRTFTFDKVFGPQARQQDLYDQAIVPIVNEVLEGFNCTIFAYGQTGTGKTFTMEGNGKKTKDAEMPVDAGVIPRAVQQIVDTLEAQNAEYSMKVTFLELYNEEITDLLAPEDLMNRSILDDKQKKPIALMEDGKGGVLVRGLEEEIVYSATEIYSLLDRGSAKRRTAETLLNKQSSRSHSIFSITIHIKEATPEGEELLKCGKLNLVDLAGSENISRSGARDSRAREAGEINKSLLTLGRVITALVEHLGHIPYRDSKLTRLLRDSLGGKTKTCVIATISPSVLCLEETLSTLDYAHRAKNIKNKPEVNQKMMKSAMIKDIYNEMEKLKAEINAAREKNGVYLPRERYLQEEAEKKAMSEKIESMEFEIETKNKLMDSLQESLDIEQSRCEDLNDKLNESQRLLLETQNELIEAKNQINQYQYSIKEQQFIISKYQQSEDALVKQAGSLQFQLKTCAAEMEGLYSKIGRKTQVEIENQQILQAFHENLSRKLKTLHESVTVSIEQQQQYLHQMQEQVASFMSTKIEMIDTLRQRTMTIKDSFSSGLKSINELAHSHEKDSTSIFEKVNSNISARGSALEEILAASVAEAEGLFHDLETMFTSQQDSISLLICQQKEKAQLSINASNEMSKKLIAFFDGQEENINKVGGSVAQHHEYLCGSLSDLEQTYQEIARQEEVMLIEKVTEMVVAASSRKSAMINSKIKEIRESTSRKSDSLKQDLQDICDTSAGTHSLWDAYIKNSEDHFVENSSNLMSSQDCLLGNVEYCKEKTSENRGCWKHTQESIQQLEKDNHLGIDLIVKQGVYGNALLLSRLEELSDSIEADFQSGNDAIVESMNDCLKIDEQAASSMLAIIDCKSQAAQELDACHKTGVSDIKCQSDSCFNNDYMEDQPTGLTPTKKSIDIADEESIGALRAPNIEEMSQEFKERETKSSSTFASTEGVEEGQRGAVEESSSEERQDLRLEMIDSSRAQKIGIIKESKTPSFADSSLLRDKDKDNRSPLTAVN